MAIFFEGIDIAGLTGGVSNHEEIDTSIPENFTENYIKFNAEIAYNQTVMDYSIYTSMINEEVESLTEGIGDAWQSFKEWIKKLLDKIIGFIKKLIAKIKGFFSKKTNDKEESSDGKESGSSEPARIGGPTASSSGTGSTRSTDKGGSSSNGGSSNGGGSSTSDTKQNNSPATTNGGKENKSSSSNSSKPAQGRIKGQNRMAIGQNPEEDIRRADFSGTGNVFNKKTLEMGNFFELRQQLTNIVRNLGRSESLMEPTFNVIKMLQSNPTDKNGESITKEMEKGMNDLGKDANEIISGLMEYFFDTGVTTSKQAIQYLTDRITFYKVGTGDPKGIVSDAKQQKGVLDGCFKQIDLILKKTEDFSLQSLNNGLKQLETIRNNAISRLDSCDKGSVNINNYKAVVSKSTTWVTQSFSGVSVFASEVASCAYGVKTVLKKYA